MQYLNTSFKLVAFLASWALIPTALAAGDMLTPDEVQHTGISSNPVNESGLFLGAGVGFGQGRSSEDGSTPGLAVFGHVEPGFQFNRGDWGRLEVSADVFAGSSVFRTADDNLGKVTSTVPFGVMVKGGYGYSLGQHATGLLEVGVGPTMAKIKVERPDFTAETSAISGLAYMIGYKVVLPLNSFLDGTIGISWTQMQFDVSNLTTTGGNALAINRTILDDIPAAELGLRIRL